MTENKPTNLKELKEEILALIKVKKMFSGNQGEKDVFWESR